MFKNFLLLNSSEFFFFFFWWGKDELLIFISLFLIFNWSMVDLQCCVSFWCTAKFLKMVTLYFPLNILLLCYFLMCVCVLFLYVCARARVCVWLASISHDNFLFL